MPMEGALRIGAAARRLGIKPDTLRAWEKQGRIHCEHRQVGQALHRYVPLSEVLRLEQGTARAMVLYSRVWGPGQSADLLRQQERLRAAYPQEDGRIEIADVGSGLNARRPGLQRLLHDVTEGNVSTIVVEHRDRLSRFGLAYLELLFAQCGVTLAVLDTEDTPTEHNELVRDLLDLVASFSGRLYGQRSARQRALLHRVQQDLASGGPFVEGAGRSASEAHV